MFHDDSQNAAPNGCAVAGITSVSLLERARANDQQAWQQLVRVYGPLVIRWCRRSGLREEDAADVAQETFRAVSTGLTSFRPKRSVGSFRSWLRTVTRTKVVDHFRRLENSPRGRGGSTAQLHLSQCVDPLAEEEDHEAVDETAIIVSRAMELIKPEFSKQNWAAFQQVALDGRSATEVAASLGVHAQTVRQANYRIRRRLRIVLKDLIE